MVIYIISPEEYIANVNVHLHESIDMFESMLLNQLVINVLAAVVFIFVIGLIKEPIRQKSMAIMLAMAGGLFAIPPLAGWGFLIGAVIAVTAYFGLRSYIFIGVGWLIHAAWDTVLHLNGIGLMGLGPESTFGCATFDPIIALWFFFGAPSIWRFTRKISSASVT